MHYTVDRLEDGDWAVLEGEAGQVFNCPLAWLPPGIRAGDVLELIKLEGNRSSLLVIRFDEEAKEAQLQESERLLQRLKKRTLPGDVEL